MTKHENIINWATDVLGANGYSLIGQAEIIQETPWSNVIRLTTIWGPVYLKQPVPLLAGEADVIELLAQRYNASVPSIIAKNSDLHCFLMQDAGISLRKYIRETSKTTVLPQAIKHFTTFQRSTESNIVPLFNQGLPDWRLEKLPDIYADIVSDKEFLKADGITDEELDVLHALSPSVAKQLHELSQYSIPETVVQPDFNTNNILISPATQQLTIIDLGELAITHPFFSLHNFLFQATKHHGVKEQDPLWKSMLDACLENWLDIWPKNKLIEAFQLSKLLWPIYSACANYHFMHCVYIPALNTWYANNPNRLANTLREYIAIIHKLHQTSSRI